MNLSNVIKKFEKTKESKIQKIPNIGNKIKIGIFIKEGNRQRVQFFEGIVISRNNSSINTTITIRRIFQGIGIERTFPLYSPQIKSIFQLDSPRANKAKLFYLRNKIGRAAMKV